MSEVWWWSKEDVVEAARGRLQLTVSQSILASIPVRDSWAHFYP